MYFDESHLWCGRENLQLGASKGVVALPGYVCLRLCPSFLTGPRRRKRLCNVPWQASPQWSPDHRQRIELPPQVSYTRYVRGAATLEPIQHVLHAVDGLSCDVNHFLVDGSLAVPDLLEQALDQPHELGHLVKAECRRIIFDRVGGGYQIKEYSRIRVAWIKTRKRPLYSSILRAPCSEKRSYYWVRSIPVVAGLDGSGVGSQTRRGEVVTICSGGNLLKLEKELPSI